MLYSLHKEIPRENPSRSLNTLFCDRVASSRCRKLTETDLEKIRQIVREELQEAFRDTHVAFDEMDASLGEIDATFDEIDARFESINRNLDRIQIMLWIATVLVVVAGIFNGHMFSNRGVRGRVSVESKTRAIQF